MLDAHILDWDSEFFGYKIATTDLHRLTWHDAHELICWCYENGIDCLYFLADADDAETIETVESYNFHLTDVRVTLERDLMKKTGDLVYAGNVRESELEDVPILRNLVAYPTSRFYYDPHLKSKAAEMYQVWIEKSCTGYADIVFVAELDGQIAGYVTVEGNELVLVASNAIGTGATLVRHALQYLKDSGHKEALVVTQGRNIAAQRLYQRLGFVTQKVQLQFHWWNR